MAPVGRDRKDAVLAGKHLPAGQVAAVENALQPQRLELDVAKLDAAGVELQADQAAAQRLGIDVVEHLLAVELDDEMAPFGRTVNVRHSAAVVIALGLSRA